MSINELPEELLVHILSFLPRSDRLESSLTCRRWAQVIAAPPLLRDIWLDIETQQQTETATLFAKSHRRYENLGVIGVQELDFHAAFWTNVGPGLRKLWIKNCSLSSETFYSILQACPNLDLLGIVYSGGSPGIRKLDFELPSGVDLQNIRNSMRNLRHLVLTFSASADILELLLNLMPNVSSIALECELNADFLSRLPDMLGTSREVTALTIRDKDGKMADECEQLLRISSVSVRFFSYFGRVPILGELGALRNCKMLRKFYVRLSDTLDAGVLQNILRDMPELESFKIAGRWSLYRSLTREDLMPLFELKKLRDLGLWFESPVPCVSEIVCELGRMVSLEKLVLGRLCFTLDSTHLQILASLPNVRNLEIQRLRWDAECLSIILYDLKRLKILTINGDVRPSDNSSATRDSHSEFERNTSAPVDLELSSLEVLKFDKIPLTDACIGRITAHHTRLRVFHLKSCEMTEAGLMTLFQHEPLLEEAKVLYRKEIDDVFLERLKNLCPRLRLRKLDFSATSGS